jgi:putative spermidine/putrescine transport system substrate-binding protein
MDRRSFLLGVSTLAVSQLLISCGSKNQLKLRVQVLKGSIPGQIVDKFDRSLGVKTDLKFAPIEQIKDIFTQLQDWHEPKTSNTWGWRISLPLGKGKKEVADLVTLGDFWLKAAIEQKLIQPMELEQLKQWGILDQRWQNLVKRNDQGNLDPQGKVWGVPYRWGSTVIVYRRDKFQQLGWEPTDWGDLWKPEVRSRVSLLDQPREVIGLVLKKLGKSYNTENIDQVPSLESELQALNQQVKFYSSNSYLEPLTMGDTWLAVGWSSDVSSVLPRYPQLAAVIPQSGSAIWSDLWVHPTDADKNALPYQWIDFCLQPEMAKEIVLLTKSNSPVPSKIVAADIQEPLQKLLLDNPEVFAKSEFLQPLSASAMKQYDSLFTKIKG